jgi:hypothetical protein
MSCLVEWCVLRSQSNPPMCLDVWSADRSRSEFSTPLVVLSIGQSCMVFGLDFPYKLSQLSSSDKNSGKHKLSPFVQKKPSKIRFQSPTNCKPNSKFSESIVDSTFNQNY